MFITKRGINLGSSPWVQDETEEATRVSDAGRLRHAGERSAELSCSPNVPSVLRLFRGLILPDDPSSSVLACS